MVLGLVILAYMGTGSVLRSMMMIVLGLAVAMVGIDHLSGFARFTHGRVELGDGVSFLAVAMGLFGVAEILVNVEQKVIARRHQAEALARSCPRARTGSARSARSCAAPASVS